MHVVAAGARPCEGVLDEQASHAILPLAKWIGDRGSGRLDAFLVMAVDAHREGESSEEPRLQSCEALEGGRDSIPGEEYHHPLQPTPRAACAFPLAELTIEGQQIERLTERMIAVATPLADESMLRKQFGQTPKSVALNMASDFTFEIG